MSPGSDEPPELQKLLTIEQAFSVHGRVVVLPDFPHWPGPIEVDDAAELRRVDGRRERVRLQFAIEHRSLALEGARARMRSLARICVLRPLDETPGPGDELWCRAGLVRLAKAALADEG